MAHNKTLVSFLAKLLLLGFLVGSVAFNPVAEAHAAATQVASVHSYPLCPPGPPCI